MGACGPSVGSFMGVVALVLVVLYLYSMWLYGRRIEGLILRAFIVVR